MEQWSKPLKFVRNRTSIVIATTVSEGTITGINMIHLDGDDAVGQRMLNDIRAKFWGKPHYEIAYFTMPETPI